MLTDTDAEPVHVDCQRFPQRGCGSIDAAFRTAVAELMTFSSADYHVVTHDRCAVAASHRLLLLLATAQPSCQVANRI